MENGALDLFNEGLTAIQAGQHARAISFWRQAISATPTLGLEAMIRYNLVLALTEDLRDMSPGTRLNEEQTERFKEAERSLVRLNTLCSGEAPEGPVRDLDDDRIRHFAEMTKEIPLPVMAGRGYWVLADGSTGPRMVELGITVANTKRREPAKRILQDALAYLDGAVPTHRTALVRAHSRLACMISDSGDRQQAAKHASAALQYGLRQEEDQYLYLAMQIILDRTRG